MTSKSGDFFTAVSKYIIDACGGVAFGCEMDAIHKYELSYGECKKF